MPTYVYQCACGYREELRHGMNEEVVIECTYCLVPLVRKPGIGSVTFNGSGWGKD